jgi:hypothetical protein
MKMSEDRANLRNMFLDHLDGNSLVVRQHKPWTYVEFNTFYWYVKKKVIVHCWGVSKICWPDKWNEAKGVDMAINRAVAWAVRERIPPLTEYHNER